MNQEKNTSAIEFSPVEGGASARIFERILRIHLPDRRGCARLALILAAATWIPLALLSAWRGVALPGSVSEPFSHDITPHVRFLFALPLLVLADLIVGPQLIQVLRQFVASGLVPDGSLSKFKEIIAAAVSLRESKTAELIILAIAYASTVVNVQRELSTGVSSWLAIEPGAALHLTLAGWWYVLLSVPVYQFFLFRWIMRLFILAMFMFRVSRLDLEIIPTHPDRVAGLGFLGAALPPISVILLAASSVLCSSIGTQVIYRGAKLEEFVFAFGVFVFIAIIAFVMPFAMFVPKLAVARRSGLRIYGALATRYTQLFDRKWVRAEESAGEELLGTGDIQSLADMGGSFDRVANMKVFPVGLADLRPLLLAALLPAIPLVLTQVPLKDVMQILTKILL